MHVHENGKYGTEKEREKIAGVDVERRKKLCCSRLLRAASDHLLAVSEFKSFVSNNFHHNEFTLFLSSLKPPAAKLFYLADVDWD